VRRYVCWEDRVELRLFPGRKNLRVDYVSTFCWEYRIKTEKFTDSNKVLLVLDQRTIAHLEYCSNSSHNPVFPAKCGNIIYPQIFPPRKQSKLRIGL
jgi:hypothetical protein